MKRIGFLSFGHWTPSPHSQVRTASDALLQSIELAVAAEELGADGAFQPAHGVAREELFDAREGDEKFLPKHREPLAERRGAGFVSRLPGWRQGLGEPGHGRPLAERVDRVGP